MTRAVIHALALRGAWAAFRDVHRFPDEFRGRHEAAALRTDRQEPAND